MNSRQLYIAAYDVTDDRRLRASLELVRNHAGGGQKSAYEVYLTEAEHDELIHMMSLILDLDEDRFMLIRIDPRATIHALGTANVASGNPYFYIA
jgi:CRISPR-associated protein Cas2